MYEILINYNTLPQTILYYIFLISFFDFFLVLLFGNKSRWFQLHCLTNIYICKLVYNDIFSVLNQPTHSLNLLVDRGSAYTCIVLHLYHCFMFPITPMDKFHHCLFVFFGAIPMLLYWKGPFMQLTMFFTCGLPGAIDYFTLCLVKHNYILKLEQKNMSSLINNYLRFPGTIFSTTICYIGYMENITNYHPIFVGYGIFLIYFNGAYFSKLAIENNILHRLKH
uniref:TLC domain-containing protein n=1 Tax=viral metagenome TaxID=1070528 RepID=A0A6C0AKM5_9ZZZZ